MNKNEQTFFKIPYLLMTDVRYSQLSNDAKLLYGVLLDRAKLSEKNDWRDGMGCFVYYTIEDIRRDFNCCNNTVVKLFAELNGVGLLRRVKQGQGRPTKLYVFSPDAEV